MKAFIAMVACRVLLISILSATVACGEATTSPGQFVLENKLLARTLSTADGALRTVQIVNRLSGAAILPAAGPEFRLRLSQGTDRPETTFALTSSDFRALKATPFESGGRKGLSFTLTNAVHRLGVEVIYELAADDFFMRKRLVIVSGQPVTLERIDSEALEIPDAYQPYTTREITADAPGQWNPGLGQPLYTSNSATFWGIEFPAADNQVRNGSLFAGYLWGRKLEPNEPYRTYPAVLGVADDPAFVTDAFSEYIGRVRARPLRLQVQYNSWFDYGWTANTEKIAASIAQVNQELVVARGNPPFSAYVIDGGWEDMQTTWSNKVWKVSGKFDPDFASTVRAVSAAKSRLGLWLSPGCLFSAQPEVAKLRAQGFETLGHSMSMAGPRYMQALEDRMMELTRQGVGFYKLDGLFGDLNNREFELHGEKYGLPSMPQLGLEGFNPGDARLNDPKYDELKIYYLTAGTERLLRIFQRIGEVDPNLYIVMSNGAYLSPWWLMYADSVWMINARDAATGTKRTAQLAYRDDCYYDIWREKNTQFPLCSVFNHEPKKVNTGESPDEFRKYLFLCFSRGTGFLELYLKPSVLQSNDWDVLSEGLHWARTVFPTFSRARMHGGKPADGEVYGYTAWTQKQGYISVHNPSDKLQTYIVRLDRAFGLRSGSGPFNVSSPLGADSTRGLPATCKFGDSLTFELAPKEVRIVDLEAQPRNQMRSK